MLAARKTKDELSAVSSARVLLAWRSLEARRLLADIVGQPVVLAALVSLLTATMAAMRWGFAHEPAPGSFRMVIEAASSALAFGGLAHLKATMQVSGPLSGVFFPLVAARKRRLAFWLLETALLWAGLLVCAAGALASLAPSHLIAFIPAAVLGALLAAGWLWLWSPRQKAYVGPSKAETAEVRSVRGWLLIARIQWRRQIGPAPVWVYAAAASCATTAAAALSYRNNASASVGAAVLTIGALVSGALFGRVDASLARFLGREPVSLAQLVASAALPTPLVVTAVLAAAGLVIGLPPMIAWWSAAAVGGLLSAYLVTAVLHALGGKERFASFAAGVDLAICAAMLTIYAPLLWVWAPARAIVLTRRAGRLRWTDR